MPESTQTEIDRALWNVLRPKGDPVETRTTVRATGVDVEAVEGQAEVSVSVQDDGVDVRIAHVQVFVKGNHVSVVQSHPPYPISRWTILWEGDLS